MKLSSAISCASTSYASILLVFFSQTLLSPGFPSLVKSDFCLFPPVNAILVNACHGLAQLEQRNEDRNPSGQDDVPVFTIL